MLRFLLKGILRDRSRSMFPLLVVVAGVSLTVVLHAWINGVMHDIIRSSANFQTGHVKIMTREYADLSDQFPNDLALLGLADLQRELARDFPHMFFTPRILFGGLLDVPDEAGETLVQGPVFGMAVSLLDPNSRERDLLNLDEALVQGRLPRNPSEILLSEEMAQKMNIGPGTVATLLGSTMHGSTAAVNFKVVGTLRFGVSALDRGALLADLSDIQKALDMEDAAGELLGFFSDDFFQVEQAAAVVTAFNASRAQSNDPFGPEMISLRDQNGLADILDMSGAVIYGIAMVFLFMMFIVLWNAGLMSALRRYGEIGVRLAIGETKGHLYRAMLLESLILGLIGSAIGTLLGLTFAYYLQIKGLNVGDVMKDSSMVVSTVLRARVSPLTYCIGFLPGTLATFLGTATAGIGIYKRQTSQLFKELEV